MEGVAHRYVAMCDALGFAQLVKAPDTTLERLIELYEGLVGDAERLASYDITSLYSNKPPRREFRRVEHTVFSDTILFWVDACPSPPDPDEFTHVSMFFRCLGAMIAVSLKTPVPLRIGVAYGECYIDHGRRTYLGLPIVDAYQTEKSQQWVGGACHSTCDTAPHFSDVVELKYVLEYKVPLTSKAQVIGLNKAINWRGIDWPGSTTVEDVMTLLAEKARSSSDDRVRAKYNNTLAFLKGI